MNSEEYERYFNAVLTSQEPWHPYDNPDMLHYAQLNKSRQDRWLKKGQLLEETISAVQEIIEPMQWIIITEPWCGDAAHSIPFMLKMAELSDKISVELRLRDKEGSEIDQYLTNGTKSIPVLIARNSKGEDLFRWGPRPAEARDLRLQLLDNGTDPTIVKIELQKWYNADQGKAIQKEIIEQFKAIKKGG